MDNSYSRINNYYNLGNACNGYSIALTSNAKFIAPEDEIYYYPYTSIYQYPSYSGVDLLPDKINILENSEDKKQETPQKSPSISIEKYCCGSKPKNK